MRTRHTLVIACLAFAAAADARDDRRLLGIEQALAGAEGRDRFDDTIRFYWGEQPHPVPEKRFGIYAAAQKINAVARTDQQACEAAFLGALASLRDSARKIGANAIVELKSLHENREFVSDSQYECRAGYFVTKVELEGKVVLLPPAEAEASRLEGDAPAPERIRTTPVPGP